MLESYFTDTNGTVKPGTMAVGSTPFPALGLHQRDEVRLGAERLRPGFDGGGLRFPLRTPLRPLILRSREAVSRRMKAAGRPHGSRRRRRLLTMRG